MSRTTRFNHKCDAYKVKRNYPVNVEITGDIGKACKTPAAKKLLAKFRADGCKHIWISRGPMCYHLMVAQVPYRAEARNELHKCMHDIEYEIQLATKPHREYWD